MILGKFLDTLKFGWIPIHIGRIYLTFEFSLKLINTIKKICHIIE